MNAICWIMHYNIAIEAQKNFFFIKKVYSLRGRDGAGIPEPIGDGDEIQFLIPFEYGLGNG